jgi:cellulose synthase (UDP-forming)
MHSERAWSDTAEVFRHRRAAPIRLWERWLLGVLLFLGLWSVIYFGVWWFRIQHINHGVLFVLLSLATWYGVFRLIVGWYNAFHLDQPDPVPAPPGLKVAIFTTSSPGEPFEMFVRTLAAARQVRYPHMTYLLDDTREEFILVLDPDHIPLPEFLDQVLGYFQDPQVGFVQVAQAYHNANESFVARAAAEQTFAFYGPIMQGMYGTGTSVAIGANCVFRRAALDSIGGHGLGLAEDLVTSIRLHAKGWKSIYVPEVVSRGLVPSDLGSFLKQQLKWSRGVHEVLFQEYPRAFTRLTMHQKISYFMIGSYYIVGLTSFIYIAIPLVYLWTGRQPAAFLLSEYIRHALPVGLLGVFIYRFTQRWLCDPVRERGFHWRGTLLKIGSWSVYLKGLVLSVLGVAVPYIPTAKERHRGRFWTLARIPLIVIVLSVVTVLWTLFRQLFVLPESEVRITTEVTLGMLFFMIMNAILMSGRLYAAWVDRERKEE